jgi:hypothetical protein
MFSLPLQPRISNLPPRTLEYYTRASRLSGSLIADSPARRKAAKRELMDTGTAKRCVCRTPMGQFKESDDVGRSLPADRWRRARTKVKSGQGDKGDR